ncbi:conserved hypothetical protein [Verticillium alfalfae VaMs.102]|uniref:Sequence orphan n=1 Tax=Verticillium alfalfae (strain VaMs.102 / ATCC MYA-4576 / FGSC 10136) TaxID=526221 RepID=C9SSR8_VERA1|nr:conserved hypothetical protein [Verticillium alfalfae VaMs.102]EEY21833.1 conserved hypothetical protein [Verticillium alfalfae VaMs.102]
MVNALSANLPHQDAKKGELADKTLPRKRPRDDQDDTLAFGITKRTTSQALGLLPSADCSAAEGPKTPVDWEIPALSYDEAIFVPSRLAFEGETLPNPDLTLAPLYTANTIDIGTDNAIQTLWSTPESPVPEDNGSDHFDDDWMRKYIDLTPTQTDHVSLCSIHDTSHDINVSSLVTLAFVPSEGIPDIIESETSGSSQYLQVMRKTDACTQRTCLSDVDDYMLDSSDEEALANLLPGTLNHDMRMPLANTAQITNGDSQDDVDFDKALELPPHDVSTYGSDPRELHSEVDLLEDDLDWNYISTIADDTKIEQFSEIKPDHDISDFDLTLKTNLLPDTATVQTGWSHIAPFVRPPLPGKILDRSGIVGLSSSLQLRTCFRVGELMNYNTQCRRDHQQAIFEFFARATCSNRSSQTREQHFRFKDLFTEYYPHPRGKLKDWKQGSLLDKQAMELVGQQDKLCRCIGVLDTDHALDLGWRIKIINIRSTHWDEIQWVRRVMARHDTDSAVER